MAAVLCPVWEGHQCGILGRLHRKQERSEGQCNEAGPLYQYRPGDDESLPACEVFVTEDGGKPILIWSL